jgi:hypothetical protein
MESHLQEDCDRRLGGYMNVMFRLNQRFTRYLVHFKSLIDFINQHLLNLSDRHEIVSTNKEALS